MTHSLQIIECPPAANVNYLQSLSAVPFYASALKKEMQPLVAALDFTATQTQIFFLEEIPSRTEVTLQQVAEAYQGGKRQFFSSIKGVGGYLPTEKLLTYCQAHQLFTGVNLLAFESAYNQCLDLLS